MAPLFDHYVIVDWSAANTKKQGRDSIWICHRARDRERCENPPTRHEAALLLADILAAISARRERAVLGFDFPFGYPAGFAAHLGLGGAAPWRAVWDELAGLVRDDEDNRNNRFDVGALLNRRVSGRPFPFWGCPAGKAGEFLGPRHHRGHTEAEPLRERRLIDTWMTGAQPCWKLAYTGSVGSQALTGIPVVRRLRDDPRWADSARIWPFETGLGPPREGTRIVFAEVWPSWWQWRPTQQPNEVNDRAQVRHVAGLFAAADRAGELAAWFSGDPRLTPEQRRLVEREEAWTLGVAAPRQPQAPRALAASVPASPRLLRSARNDANEGRHCEERSDEAISSSLPPTADRKAFDYLHDAAAIYRRSFALVRREAAAELARLPASMRPLAMRLAHAAGDAAILADLAWSRGAAAAGRRALKAGAPILVDGEMTAAGVNRARLPAANPVICTLLAPEAAGIAAARATTRSAAAVELWRPHLAGAVVAIGSAPTALFRLLELLAEGADPPALILGFPVGFVGAAEAKDALIGFGGGLRYVALRGRRGGSALAAAAVNALAGGSPG